MTKKFIIIILLVALSSMFIGCRGNIFGWLYPGDDTDFEDVDDLVEAGDIALRKGDFETAKKCYWNAIQKNPRSSRARFGYARAFILSKNVDLLYMASKLYAEPQNANIVMSELINDYKFTDTMTTVIDVLNDPQYSIVNQQCDGDIPYNDFAVNFDLMISYFFRALISIGDSNNDKQYFTKTATGGDFLYFGGEGEDLLVENTNVIKQEENRKEFDENFTYITNNLGSSIEKSYFVNVLHMLHEIIEDIIYIYYLSDLGLDDFLNFNLCWTRGVQGLIGNNEVINKMVKDADKSYNEFKVIKDNAIPDTDVLNADHNDIVGVNAYTGTYKDYQRETSPWSSHWGPASGGLALLLEGAPDPLNPAPLAEGPLMSAITTKATQVLNHVKNMDLIKTYSP